MEYKLKPIDEKLLAYLYGNSRAPATKISKDLKISREQVVYRIKKFEKDGIIKGYIPLINYNKLGYHIVSVILFKLKSPEDAEVFKKDLKTNKNRTETVETVIGFDVGMMFVFQNEKERNDVLSKILETENKRIVDYLILEPYFSELYPLKFLGIKENSPKIFHEYKKEVYKLDEKEKKILKVLSENANTSIVEISERTNISSELVLYKMRKLQKENVLLGTRAYFNMKKTGFFYSLILIEFHNFSEENKEKMKNFARQSKNTDSLMFNFGKKNCYLQIFHRNVEEIHEIMNELKKAFPRENLKTEIILLKDEGVDVNLTPFL